MLKTSNPSQYTALSPDSTSNRTSTTLRTPTSPLAPSTLSKNQIEADNTGDAFNQSQHAPTIFSPSESDSTRYSTDSPRTPSDDAPMRVIGGKQPPHLSLKEQATSSLPSMTSTQASDSKPAAKEDELAQTSLANIALKLRPENRWSQGSESSLLDSNELNPNQTHLDLPTPTIPDRPNTALDLEDPGFLAATTASPILRPATSEQDYPNLVSFNIDASISAKVDTVTEDTQTLTGNERLPDRRRPTIGQESATSTRADSVRSAATNISSVPDLSSTAHTSTWTDRSSVSEAVPNTSNLPAEQDDDLTVEDCIAMYARGFHDDPPTEIPVIPEEQPLKLPETKPIPESRAPSESTTTISQPALSPETTPIPEQDTAKSPTSVSHLKSPSTASYLSSSDSRSIQTETTIDPSLDSPTVDNYDNPPPPLPPPPQIPPVPYPPEFARNLLGLQNPARDHYGFKKETQNVRIEDYNVWEPKYKQYLERRRRKWVHLMNETGCPSVNPKKFPPKSDKVKRYVRKGIPPLWRGAAWYFYADGDSFVASHPGLYRRTVAEAANGRVTENDRELIERDLHRTLPENKHFKPDNLGGAPESPVTPGQLEQNKEPEENPMIKSLRNLLQAFAVHYPHIGYCQSLNFLAAHLLLFMRSAFPDDDYEERAFALLCIITETYLPGTHGVVLEGANVDIGVLMMLIQESMPNLWSILDDKSERGAAGSPAISRQGTAALPSVSLATTAWFMSCFVSTLPIETTCRVWDCLWYEGSKTIFRVALAMFKLGERDIKKTKDPMEMFQVIQNLPRSLLDANLLMDIATKKRKVPGSDNISSRIGPGVGGFGGLSQKTVERLREERRALCQRERERTESTLHGFAPPPIPDETSTLTRSLSRSSSRAHSLKRFKSVRKLVGKE